MPEAAPGKPPLSGYRVIDITQMIAGPVACELLSDMGAEVIKVEPIDGESTRHTAGVLPMEGLAIDRDLTPDYPGVSTSADISGWDPPFPVDLKRVRKKDEDYWDEYRAAMISQGKCLLRLSIETWSQIATGGFPPRLAD